ncbi:MAG: ribbon-helix-helix domain-containing protein [Desulfovermiculus sp.]
MSKKKSLASALTGLDEKNDPRAAKAETPAPEERESSGKVSAPRSRRGKKAVAGHFDPEVARQLKMIGLEEDRSLQDLLTEAINELFKKHGKPPIA